MRHVLASRQLGMSRVLAQAAVTAAIPQRVRMRAFSFDERVPPKEIQLWNLGDNATDYGVHKWTARSASEVFARYDVRGNPLLIDVEHNGAKIEEGENEDEPAVTGGYARLELRAGAPWLVFEWSAYAVEQIATGQRRFLSPEYDVDRLTGEILAVYRVSLVADPGTHRARMLAAATQGQSMDPKLAAIMAILGSVSDPAAAIEAIKSLVANLDGGDAGGGGAPAADPPMAADAPPGGGGDAPADDKDKPTTTTAAAPAATVATAAPAAAPVVATTPAAPAAPAAPTKVEAAATAAVLQIENASRDHLLTTEGDRLDPSIRKWASSQPLAVVRGLINAAPAKQGAPVRAAATIGATQGQEPAAKGLEGAELEQLDKAMGIFKAAAPEPHKTAAGVLVLPAVPPSVHRERKRAAAAAAAAQAAGKAGK